MDQKPSQAIAQWPEGERPRELILAKGPGALTDAQLLAIVLRVGRRSRSAVQVGRDLLEHLGGLQGLANRSARELCAIPGIGQAKAAQIKAAVELGKRVLTVPMTKGTVYTQSKMVFDHYKSRLRDLRKEECQVILLDTKRAVIRESTVSRGTLTSSLVHPREVFNEAVRESAAAMIFVHNHPSGDPTPSQEDRAMTARLQAAGDILGVQVLDHIIIGDNRYTSFADEGWLSSSPMAPASRKAPRSR